MRKTWIHPEYKLLLQSNAAGAIGVVDPLVAEDPGAPEDEQPARSPASDSWSTRLMVSLVLGLCCISITFTEYADLMHSRAIIVQKRGVRIGAARKGPIISLAGVENKQAFLARLVDERLGHINNHTRFINELIHGQPRSGASIDRRVAAAIVRESLAADYDPLLVAAVIKAESTFKEGAVSEKGAQGLMQILPETGRYISEKNSLTWLGRHTLHEPEFNIKLGIAYLKELQKTFKGNLKHALIAYNWGPGNLLSALKNGGRIPSSTEHYAQKILKTHAQWRKDLGTKMAGYRFMKTDSALS